ncbi:hypothetical protein PPGU16_74580 (plasmid) [Paraburkholderia largidicola]|uniref:Uncharacterized protein n=1 Tax=Paraburkholderia largidicola TaxID=3014751 RepID=A0A7I8C1M2_9BURK|nr:hypothetical protein PPGU16_74580 [Paraburkholderia sp. PGU16]
MPYRLLTTIYKSFVETVDGSNPNLERPVKGRSSPPPNPKKRPSDKTSTASPPTSKNLSKNPRPYRPNSPRTVCKEI